MSALVSPFGVAAALLVTGAALAACDVKVGDKGMSLDVAREKLNTEWSRSYTLPSGRFELSTGGGSIEVTGTDGPQLDVRIVQEASAMTKDAARQAIDSVSIQETAAADHVSVDVRSKTGEGPRGRLSTRATVRLPRGVAATINSRDGEIRLESVNGTVTAAVTNGAIFGRGASGALSASVVNGRVAIDFASLTAPVALTAKNGNINIGVPSDAKADFDATALNGGIRVDSQIPIVSEAERGDRDGGGRRGFLPTNQLLGRLNGGGPKVTLQVTNGAVRISPPGLAPAPRPR